MTNDIATSNHEVCSRLVSASQTTTIQLLAVSLPTEVKTINGWASLVY